MINSSSIHIYRITKPKRILNLHIKSQVSISFSILNLPLKNPKNQNFSKHHQNPELDKSKKLLPSLRESKSVSDASRSSSYSDRYQEANLNEPSLIIENFIYLGGHWSYNNPELLIYLGITHVLNLARELPIIRIKGKKIKIKHIKAIDSENYNLRYDFDEAFKFIDRVRDSNGRILINCAMGISRSATIVIAYLMSRYYHR